MSVANATCCKKYKFCCFVNICKNFLKIPKVFLKYAVINNTDFIRLSHLWRNNSPVNVPGTQNKENGDST